MPDIIEENDTPRDYYAACLENGTLTMQPYCACGNSLDEDFFCEKCRRRCHCRQIICDNTDTLKLVKDYIRKSPQFSAFEAKLAG